MRSQAWVVPTIGLLVAACESPVAPAACGALPQLTVHVGERSGVTACFNDANGDALNYAVASSNPSVAEVSVAGAEVTVRALSPGAATVTLTASDPAGFGDQQSFRVVVPNRAPRAVGTVPEQRVEAGTEIVVDLGPWFEEPDGEQLRFRVTVSDVEVADAAVSGSRVTLAARSKGTADIAVTATDPGGLAAVQVFGFAVPNRGPVALGVIEGQVMRRGETRLIDLAPWFADPDGEPLRYASSSSSPGAVAATTSGAALRLSAVGAGRATITVTARDPDGLTATHTFGAEAPNRPPAASGGLPDIELGIGDTIRVSLAGRFEDPDGDALTYTASSSDTAFVSAAVLGEALLVSGVREGKATITVAASDSAGLSAVLSFRATVEGSPGDPASFQIELRFATVLTAAQEMVFQKAASRWMAILGDTELPDMPVPEGVVSCRSSVRKYEQDVSVVDDLMIVAAVEEIDGVGGTLGRAGPCGTRQESMLPWFGLMEFDAADLDQMEADGILESVILHEMGHVLGIGVLWDRFGLLRNPSLVAEQEVDTHFAGALAVRAFDEVGGASYTAGAKVPVENKGIRPGSDDVHWRRSVFGNELMNPSAEPVMPLSAVTIASLSDLGYAVRADLADVYRLPDAAALRAHRRRAIPLGNDVIRGPIEIRDLNGVVVGIIRP